MFTHPCEFSDVGTHTMGRIKIVIERLPYRGFAKQYQRGGGVMGKFLQVFQCG